MSDIRSRRAGMDPAEARGRPLYARVLGLQYIRPSSLLCFLFFEGTVALAVLLALAELADWWAVAVLPGSIAVMVKINDVVAGASARSGAASARGGRPARDPRSGRGAKPATARPGRPAGQDGGARGARQSGALRRAPVTRAQAGRTQPAREQPVRESIRERAARTQPPPREQAQPLREQPVPARGRAEVVSRQQPWPPPLPVEPDAGQVSPASGEPWITSAEQRARQSAAYRYE